MAFSVVSVSGTNSGSATADVVVAVDNPLTDAPDKLYVMWKDANSTGILLSYNSETNQIQVTFKDVPAGASANADIIVKKIHPVEAGGQVVSATVNSTNPSVSGVAFAPDLVLVTSGAVNDTMEWSYDPETNTVTFANLSTADTNVEIIKLHSIQHNQNGTADGSGVLHGQNEKPDILMEAGKLVGVSKSHIDSNYDAENRTISGLTANANYISIPVHSIFRG